MNLFQRAFHLAHHVFPEGGTCLEFGVFSGSTYSYQAAEIRRRYSASRLIGFDSWQGLPEETDGVWAPLRHSTGEYAAPKDIVLSKLKSLGIESDDPQFRLVDGYFADSLTDDLRRRIGQVVFINIDVDIYRSTIELLDFVRPLLRPGVILYWDDWKDPRDENQSDWGEHLAWEHWLKAQKDLVVETLEINPVNQRTMIVTEVDGKRIQAPLPSMSDIRYFASELINCPTNFGDSDYVVMVGLIRRQIERIPLLYSLARLIRRLLTHNN